MIWRKLRRALAEGGPFEDVLSLREAPRACALAEGAERANSGEAVAVAVTTRVALVRESRGDGDAFVFVRRRPIRRSITGPAPRRRRPPPRGRPRRRSRRRRPRRWGARRVPRRWPRKAPLAGRHERPLFANSGRSRRRPRFGTPTIPGLPSVPVRAALGGEWPLSSLWLSRARRRWGRVGKLATRGEGRIFGIPL